MAIAFGVPEIVTLCIKEGANPNIIKNDSETPLQKAAIFGDTAIVYRLLLGGANPFKFHFGRNAL